MVLEIYGDDHSSIYTLKKLIKDMLSNTKILYCIINMKNLVIDKEALYFNASLSLFLIYQDK